MFIGMIAFWALLIFGAAYLIRATAGPDGKVVHADASPLETLKRRYAEGQISREQFEAMRREIS